jgi:poly-gamma-glutamate capsule biosynthesis protein CapA/YwtB (metallophosphatase superfamily)
MSAPADPRTLFLCGDFMPARGIDQILRHPSQPILYERAVTSALEYVALAEDAHGSRRHRGKKPSRSSSGATRMSSSWTSTCQASGDSLPPEL